MWCKPLFDVRGNVQKENITFLCKIHFPFSTSSYKKIVGNNLSLRGIESTWRVSSVWCVRLTYIVMRGTLKCYLFSVLQCRPIIEIIRHILHAFKKMLKWIVKKNVRNFEANGAFTIITVILLSVCWTNVMYLS